MFFKKYSVLTFLLSFIISITLFLYKPYNQKDILNEKQSIMLEYKILNDNISKVYYSNTSKEDKDLKIENLINDFKEKEYKFLKKIDINEIYTYFMLFISFLLLYKIKK